MLSFEYVCTSNDVCLLVQKMNTACLMKFTLNFDPNADINWRRRRPVEIVQNLQPKSTIDAAPAQ